MKQKFSENLKRLREEKKISQLTLAKLLGVTQQCISEWELNKTEPTLTYIVKLSEIFEVSIDYLCGKSEW